MRNSPVGLGLAAAPTAMENFAMTFPSAMTASLRSRMLTTTVRLDRSAGTLSLICAIAASAIRTATAKTFPAFFIHDLPAIPLISAPSVSRTLFYRAAGGPDSISLKRDEVCSECHRVSVGMAPRLCACGHTTSRDRNQGAGVTKDGRAGRAAIFLGLQAPDSRRLG